MEEDTIHTADDLYQEIANVRTERNEDGVEWLEKWDREDNVENFLKELTALSQKYGIIIAGCGCDGSPWLETMDIVDWSTLLTNLTYDSKKERYQ